MGLLGFELMKLADTLVAMRMSEGQENEQEKEVSWTNTLVLAIDAHLPRLSVPTSTKAVQHREAERSALNSLLPVP